MPPTNDPRIQTILDLLMELAAGNLHVHADHSGEGDELDAIIESVNMLAEELRASTDELKTANERLVRTEKLALMGQLCGGVAHELRNPLGALRNAAYFLKMAVESTEPEVTETLEIIDKEVRSCERIIGNLLDFARPRDASQVKVDVDELVDKVLHKLVIPPTIEVRREPDGPLPKVLADPDQLYQAFSNVILNAVQAMAGRDGQLTVSTTTEQKHVLISVVDTGVGICHEDLNRIFEPLFTTKAKGIGLGLAVTRTVIDKHGGEIKVQSEQNQGTTFEIRLPAYVTEGS
jgi:signal transduction histidine kinase